MRNRTHQPPSRRGGTLKKMAIIIVEQSFRRYIRRCAGAYDIWTFTYNVNYLNYAVNLRICSETCFFFLFHQNKIADAHALARVLLKNIPILCTSYTQPFILWVTFESDKAIIEITVYPYSSTYLPTFREELYRRATLKVL